MGSVVLAGATSGSTTLTPVDAVTATITLPSVTSTLLAVAAAGTANQKLFMNAAGTQQEFATGFFVGQGTRDCTTASGSVAYTGVGFKASALIVFMTGGLGTNDISFGMGTLATNRAVIGLANGGFTDPGTFLMWDYQSAGVNQRAVIASFDSDGFTLTWTKQGSPTGTLTFNYLALR